jgi:5,10-methylenetetrahydrofolate reductase
VDKSVVPGIMPVTNKGLIERMSSMSRTALPGWLQDRLEATDDPHEIGEIAAAPRMREPHRPCGTTAAVIGRNDR